MSLKEFNKSILITGGAGFIGSAVVNYIFNNHNDYYIVVYDRLDYASRLANITVKNSDRFKFIKGDINDKLTLLTVLQDHKIDTVMHFAAQTHVDNSFNNEEQFIIDNVMGTNSILKTCLKYGKITRFIHVSTDEVYGEVEHDHTGCLERDIMAPTNPYAATKAGAEHIAKAYYKSYKMPIIITRGNNVYGPGQYPEKIVSKFTMSMMLGLPVTIHGQGQSYRNFIFIDDVARAFDIILTKGEIGEIYNIGTDEEYNVIEILEMIETKLGMKSNRQYVTDRNFNDKRYRLNSDKLRSLGHKCEFNIDQGLDITIQWCRDVLEEFKYKLM